jgi:hypothetical protein
MSEEFDLSGLEALVQSQEEGIEIEILNEQGKPIGLKIRIVGPDSNRMKKACATSPPTSQRRPRNARASEKRRRMIATPV